MLDFHSDTVTAYADVNIAEVHAYRIGHPNWKRDLWQSYFASQQALFAFNAPMPDQVMDVMGNDLAYDSLRALIDHCRATHQNITLHYIDNTAAIIGYNGRKYALPAHCVTPVALKDYSGLTVNELKSIGGTSVSPTDLVPANSSTTEIQNNLNALDSKAASLEEEAKQIASGEAEELADLKAQLDEITAKMEKAKKDLLAELDAKRKAMEAEKAEFKKKLFYLETQIYGIRCYLGEVVNFYTLRTGREAPVNTPVVVYQKLRFLDEELGRYTSLYGFGAYKEDKEELLEILKTNDDVADLLAPGPKSISVVKISRTGTVKRASDVVENTLKTYRMYHSNQLALLVRNGENLHITWLDVDKINVSDDNIFFVPKEDSVAPAETLDLWEQKQKEQKEKIARKEMLSRWFFFTVLQGIVDSGKLLRIPDKTDVLKMNSPYIVYSAADGWLADKKYGSFEDMLKKSAGIPLIKGDLIMTGTRLVHEKTYSRSYDDRWNNDRGIGERNRTRNVSLPGQELLHINKVIPGILVEYTVEHRRAHIITDPHGREMYRNPDGNGGSYLCSYKSEGGEFAKYETTYSITVTDEVLETYTETKLISGDSWYGGKLTSYRQLTEKDLRIRSGIGENCLYYKENGRERAVHDYAAAYSNDYEFYVNRITGCRIIGERDHQYYCSVKQNGWGGSTWDFHETEYHVNFRVYEDEFIPVNFLCPSWIAAVIRSGNVGTYRLCSASMEFADMLPYLQKILPVLKTREEAEKSLIINAGGGEWIENTPEWDAVLCEWRIKERCHTLTERTAKRFLKSTKSAAAPHN